jgi:uncharacterized membrane protein
MRRVTLVIALALVVLATVAGPVGAQTAANVNITANYPGVVADPGDTASFALQVTASTQGVVDLAVEGIPDGWTATFRGGNSVVNKVTAGPDLEPELRLDVTIPTGTVDGDYPLTVRASSGTETATLPLLVTVQGGATGSVTLTPDASGLRGPANVTFTFNVEVKNDTPAEVQLELDAEGPIGWTVDARPQGQSQATSISVNSGATGRVTVTATPPSNAAAGNYDLRLTARGGGINAETPLVVQITGSYSMRMTTPDDRLNTSLTVGQPGQFQFLVINTGSAPLNDVTLSATPPSNWDVSFDTETITSIAPGQFATVNATITPATGAIAGDYQITFRANHDQANATMEVRATVNPSALGGFVGVGLIVLVLAALSWVFRRFGRR